MSIIQKAYDKEHLDIEETKALFNEIMTGELSPVQISGALVAMKVRGETPEEVAGAAMAMNDNKKVFEMDGVKAVDTCGTGGDGKSTVNVSTAVSLVLSTLGIPVIKHGNVAMSGKVGSADILRLKNIPIEFEEGQAEEYFKKNNFVFLFAQKFHPAMRFAGPVRKELKTPTIFNMLGPLANPANVYSQIIGMGSLERIELVAEAVKLMGRDNVILYTSADGYDEVSSNAMTTCKYIKDGKIHTFTISPEDYFEKFEMPVVEDDADAVAKFDAALDGSDEQLANLIALNAALALYGYGEAGRIVDGFNMAKECIMSGKVIEKIKELGA